MQRGDTSLTHPSLSSLKSRPPFSHLTSPLDASTRRGGAGRGAAATLVRLPARLHAALLGLHSELAHLQGQSKGTGKQEGAEDESGLH